MSKTRFDHPWTLVEALTLFEVTGLESELQKVGYHFGLTGSVLTKGKSTKDLDLIIYPASPAVMSTGSVAAVNVGSVHSALKECGFVLVITRDVVSKQWRRLGSLDEKVCEIWSHNNRRVDIFYMR